MSDGTLDFFVDRIANLETSQRALLRHAEQLEQQLGIHGGYAELTAAVEADGTSRVSFSLNGDGPGVRTDGSITIHSDTEQVDDGCDVGKDGARYRRYKPGVTTWWVTVDGVVWFVTTRKPERVATGNSVMLKWGAA